MLLSTKTGLNEKEFAAMHQRYIELGNSVQSGKIAAKEASAAIRAYDGALSSARLFLASMNFLERVRPASPALPAPKNGKK